MRTIKHYAILSLAGLIVLGGLFATTNPEQLPSAALFLVFIGLYIFLGSSSVLIISVLSGKRSEVVSWRTQKAIWSLTVVPVFLLLLQSIGQLTVRDVLLALALTTLGFAYAKRMSQKPSE